ncbi:MAG: hypothetical protein A2275_06090 [Bacteroidetes bacterium RIFOXYA12_FULL_35_11]|nr:MAG: hypothetical protein A2X01_01655 [Bacteroidetes bacterium GWF2_35_48]OFY74188.1 MAG: hypothetical protein A2275_06090 [Bacteroidetes bacterium RIFOXYA12_FULL_35_11]OFY93797.1 MAG: hypothetical protein A2491_02665 [Bacteroidetes bacterium RIFOXYC12_FULL_35_7]OFY96744.1 MAG: hypothetical protein A2309_00935 [Bacteroidetes bacterium RIFOXYB2_FULL_35_7]HBX53752.1 transposase [Bacteroidales bacterium]
MKYNPQIHHRRSIRLKGYDYSQAGLYFITICVHEKKHLFGNIENGEMILNDAGKIANECWLEIPNHFPNAVLHEHIVMPNHVHGVIQLLKNNDTVGIDNYQSLFPHPSPQPTHPSPQPTHPSPQPTQPSPQPSPQQPPKNEFQKIIPRSIGSIVRGFKIGVTKWVHANSEIHTVWQRNYYEHIIRDEQSYQKISEYIVNNPANWKNDKFKNE